MAALRFVTIVGARPQFVKAAVVSRAIRVNHDELLVHTGQHYDPELSDVFFREMGIPSPDVQLETGSGTHGQQTAAMLTGIEQVLIDHRPDWVVTFGDTNSTLAGALAASKLGVPIAHVEAGLRSFNWSMPEEINRVLVDRLSQALFCPSTAAADNLAAEGIRSGVHVVGDVMAEALAFAAPIARDRSRVLEELALVPGEYLLVTVHRAENTDDPGRLGRIVSALNAADQAVVFPAHPRTRKALERTGLTPGPNVHVIPPVGYLDMIRLLTSARMVLTDSGGVQKEAYWSSVPCVTLRSETEWVETVAVGWNVVAGTDVEQILSAVRTFTPPLAHPELYGGPGVAARCVGILEAMAAKSTASRAQELIGR